VPWAMLPPRLPFSPLPLHDPEASCLSSLEATKQGLCRPCLTGDRMLLYRGRRSQDMACRPGVPWGRATPTTTRPST
jgi:hypothetical protein